MLIYEYKLRANQKQQRAIAEAIRTAHFVRNKALRYWIDNQGTGQYDLQAFCAQLAKEHPFAARLNSMARQASADRAWQSIARFYANCQAKKPGKKGYPRFQKDNRSVEYKTSGWKLKPDGKRLTFTDGHGIGTVRLIGTRSIEMFPVKQIKRVRLVKRLAKQHLKVQRQRKDFAAKTARALVQSHDLVAFEDLNIAGLVKNRKLAKSISDAAWGQFLSWLCYYGEIASVPVIGVSPQFTTQDCSGCGERVKKALSVRTHVCPACGLVLDRDQNAALNILELALTRTAGQAGTGSGSPEHNASGQRGLCLAPAMASGTLAG